MKELHQQLKDAMKVDQETGEPVFTCEQVRNPKIITEEEILESCRIVREMSTERFNK